MGLTDIHYQKLTPRERLGLLYEALSEPVRSFVFEAYHEV
jgi:hypothetical protein